jgi:uncharacterized protein (TIGR03437 family)
MPKNSHSKTISLILIAIVLSVFYFAPPLRAQPEREFEAKADADLKLVYQAFRRQPGVAPSAARQREQAMLKRQVALEERAGEASVGVLIRLRGASEAALAAAQAEVASRGFAAGARIGDVAAMTVRVDDLPRLAEAGAVMTISAASYAFPDGEVSQRVIPDKRSLLRAVNDAANVAARAPDARSTFNVTGRGVIVSVMDTGIDWRHADFRNADGSTRIKALWDISDQTNTGPDNLGRVYTEAEINAALQSGSGVNETDTNGHGTHVAGIAAGNGRGAAATLPPNVFSGIAPEADLVIVKATRTGSDTFRTDDLLRAMAWIRDQAVARNQPFVINMSIGGQTGMRDGSEPFERAIDNLLTNVTGRHFTQSAGNTGSVNNHAGGVLAQGQEVTLPFTVTGSGATGIQSIYDAGDLIIASLVMPDNTMIGPVPLGQSNTDNAVARIFNQLSATGNGAAEVRLTLTNPPVSGSAQWRLTLKAERVVNGRYDAWSADRGLTRFDASVASGANETGWPKGAFKPMTVANFVSKTQWTDFNGQTRALTSEGPVGQHAASSSGGPTRDGRLKPNIAAPGTYLMSTLSTGRPTAPSASLIPPGGGYVINFGTSMSSPIVCGVIALMLQADRNLSPDQITRILQRTAGNDGFTGQTISLKYGYGKVNALAAVRAVVERVAAAEFVSLSAASFAPDAVAAPESIVAGFGAGLAPGVAAANTTPLPTQLLGVSVRITDSAGAQRLAGLFFVSAGQINYAVPAGVAQGVAQVDVLRDGQVVARGAISVNPVWPALFTANASGRGLGAATVVRALANGQQVFESAANPIDLSRPGERVFLALFGSGLRGRSDLSHVRVALGGAPTSVLYAGPAPGFVGLDQINVELPSSLAGRGQLDLLTYVDGWAANPVQFTIR